MRECKQWINLSLNDVKAWSIQATEIMRRVAEYRQQIEEKLESVITRSVAQSHVDKFLEKLGPVRDIIT